MVSWPLLLGEEENIMVERYGERLLISMTARKHRETGEGQEQVCVFPGHLLSGMFSPAAPYLQFSSISQ